MKQLLSRPGFYEWFQRLVGADQGKERYVREFLQVNPGERILDIGCGPGNILPFLPAECHYVGVDLSQSYIDQAKKIHGERGKFLCCSVDAVNPEELGGEFDLAMANGVIHHLNDDETRSLFRLSAQKLKPTGRFISLDGCYTPKQNMVARWMLRNDRGQFVREQPAYEALAATAFEEVHATLCTNLLRIPYTHLIMRCTRPRST